MYIVRRTGLITALTVAFLRRHLHDCCIVIRPTHGHQKRLTSKTYNNI